jgi:hypothetical protein
MGRRRPPIAWSLILPVAAVELLLLVATANRYCYHRDELISVSLRGIPLGGTTISPL